MTLLNNCYEQIKEKFCYGILGGFKLTVDKTTGYLTQPNFASTAVNDSGIGYKITKLNN